VKSLFHHKKRMPSLFPLLQLFLGFVLLAQIVFFRETEEERGVSSFVETCRACEQALANDVVWGENSWSLELDNQAKCKFPFLEAKKAVDDVRERFRQLSNRRKDILFIGNSVSRRQLYAVAHILGGEKARVNPIANNETLQERYGIQRVFDSKLKYHNAFEVEVNLESGEMGEQSSCLPDSIENIAEEILKEKNAMRCSKPQLKMDQPGVVRLAFLYVGSGSKAHKAVLKAFDAWIEGAKSRKGGYVLDTYNMIVIQVGLDSSVLQLDRDDGYGGILQRVKELVSLREDLRVIFSGIHHHFINANHDDFEYQEKLREFLDKSLWPSVRKIKGTQILDTTRSTIEGVRSGVLEHERGSSWHFMDKGRIFLASLLVNHLLRSCV
tara:strand:- start:75 stop:1223 length:1149 start_codon:yes stop_codon:yes gene_type:complete